MMQEPPTRYRMYIDDAGCIADAATNEPERRYGSITGVIMDMSYTTPRFVEAFQKWKVDFFGLTGRGKVPILHRRKILKADPPFNSLTDEQHRNSFNSSWVEAVEKTRFTVITCAVDKIGFYYKYPNWRDGIYKLLMQNILERYFYFLKASNAIGDVMVESVNPGDDKIIENLYRSIYREGTFDIKAHQWNERLTTNEIKISDKNEDIPGIQFADMFAQPCLDLCRSIYAGHEKKPTFNIKIAEIIEASKFYRDANGNPHTYGRVWRPK